MLVYLFINLVFSCNSKQIENKDPVKKYSIYYNKKSNSGLNLSKSLGEIYHNPVLWAHAKKAITDTLYSVRKKIRGLNPISFSKVYSKFSKKTKKGEILDLIEKEEEDIEDIKQEYLYSLLGKENTIRTAIDSYERELERLKDTVVQAEKEKGLNKEYIADNIEELKGELIGKLDKKEIASKIEKRKIEEKNKEKEKEKGKLKHLIETSVLIEIQKKIDDIEKYSDYNVIKDRYQTLEPILSSKINLLYDLIIAEIERTTNDDDKRQEIIEIYAVKVRNLFMFIKEDDLNMNKAKIKIPDIEYIKKLNFKIQTRKKEFKGSYCYYYNIFAEYLNALENEENIQDLKTIFGKQFENFVNKKNIPKEFAEKIKSRKGEVLFILKRKFKI